MPSDVDKTTDIIFISYINFLRYRGYYYDSEIRLYYLNAKYYNPEVDRLISADETLKGEYNLFEYCVDNLTNFSDYNGHDLDEAIIERSDFEKVKTTFGDTKCRKSKHTERNIYSDFLRCFDCTVNLN